MPSSEPPPESEPACRLCGGVLLESSGGVCVRCSSIGEGPGVNPGYEPTEIMTQRDERSASGAKCVRCGVTMITARADGWCEPCLAQAAVVPPAPELPSIPPVQIPGYRMLRPLGRGGMGVVWLAEQRATKQTVAIKFCREDRFSYGSDSSALRRFAWEMEVAARLSHPHIARVFGGGDIAGLPYCVMEYVEGADLAEHTRSRRLDRKAVVALMAQVAEAVQHAHQNGIIHRDLKPSGLPPVFDPLAMRVVVGFRGLGWW